MSTRTEDRLTELGSTPTPSARPDFVTELEARLRGLPTVETARDRRVAPTRWLAAGAAAALLALLGVGLLNTGGESEVRTLSPTASSTLEPSTRDEPEQKATHDADDGSTAPAPSKDDAPRTPSSSQPAERATTTPAPLPAKAFQHHTRVMVVWERYEGADFAYYEVRRQDDHRPGHSVLTRIKDHEENGTADDLRDANAKVRYQIVVVSRDGTEVAISEWITPEPRPERESSEPSPLVTIP